MKKLYLILFALIALSSNLNAQTTLTQSTSTNVEPNNTTSCNTGLNTTPPSITADNIYYRVFDLVALGYSEFDVSEVTFGVESIANESSGFAVDVIVYENSGGAFPNGTLTMINSVSVPLTSADSGALISAFISANVSASEMVIALSIPDERAAGNETECLLGSNSDGETNPTYLASDSCSILSPSTMADIGFPNVHLVMEITGAETLSLDNFELSKVSVSPNPASNVVNVKVHPSNNIKNIDVYDLKGQLVYKGLKQSMIDISDLSAGVYMLSITTENGNSNKRIIKQ